MAFTLSRAEEERTQDEPVRCPLCGHSNEPAWLCRHVRWTFAQGTPLDFARRAVAESPTTGRMGFGASDLPRGWWDDHAERVMELVHWRFEPIDGYVFGELAGIDLLARDIWNEFAPQPARSPIQRS